MSEQQLTDSSTSPEQQPTQRTLVFTNEWFVPMIPSWTRLLAEFKGRDNLQCLEIGSYEGRSGLWLCDNILSTCRNAKLVAIDTFEGGVEHRSNSHQYGSTLSVLEERFRSNLQPYIDNQTVDVRRGYSSAVLSQLIGDRNGTFDFCYVDGSHMAADVLIDGIMCWLLLKDGGILAFDDYPWDGMRRGPAWRPQPAIDALLQCFEGQYELLHKDWQVFIRKRTKTV